MILPLVLTIVHIYSNSYNKWKNTIKFMYLRRGPDNMLKEL